MTELTHFSKARQELSLASTIDEVKEIRDRAEAIRAYCKQAGESLEIQNMAAEIKLRAERRAGEMLREMEKNPGGPDRVRLHDVTAPPRLTDLGVSKIQSSRWQAVAGIPERIFDEFVSSTKQNGAEITSAAALRIAKDLLKKNRLNEIANVESSTSIVETVGSLISSGAKFSTIYADPPWQYGNQGTRASTDNHYPTMSVDELCDLPIKEILKDQAHLHLWTTNAFLFHAKTVIEAWGFEYKSCFVWVKPQMGMGNYWRVSHEFLLLGVKGGLTFLAKNQMSWIQSDRRSHSEKPEIVRSIIESTSPPPFLELFGRKGVDRWTVLGNQVDPISQSRLFNE